LAEPLIKQNSNDALPSMHYAASDLFGQPQYPTMAFSSASTSSCRSVPASPNRQYMTLACNRQTTIPTGIPSIDPAELDFVESLGTGEFAHVDLCRYNGRLVAVKYLREGASGDTVAGFRGELIALSRLHHHNVIRVIGTCTTSGGSMTHASIVMEYMRNGDLCHYLKRQGTMRFDQLLSIASQIAAGMAYLESVHFVHRDLACRNCLVDSDGTVKIADFGMARSLYNADYYRLDGKAVLPIRWMAWECLLRGEFTTKSDVWALGVTLWEVFDACRQKPFAELADEDVIGNLEHMYHNGNLKFELPPPRHCPSNAFVKVLKPCWRREPTQRPSSADIHLELQNLTRMLAQ
ncbi:Protein DDR-2 b, partial [Aphelenchoides avenae]